jgi:hypothetical protein
VARITRATSSPVEPNSGPAEEEGADRRLDRTADPVVVRQLELSGAHRRVYPAQKILTFRDRDGI